jgi:hypothetical protein
MEHFKQGSEKCKLQDSSDCNESEDQTQLVDLSQNSLNFLAGIVAQMRAINESICNDFNSLDASSPLEAAGTQNLGGSPTTPLTGRAQASEVLLDLQLDPHVPDQTPTPVLRNRYATLEDIAALSSCPTSPVIPHFGYPRARAAVSTLRKRHPIPIHPPR